MSDKHEEIKVISDSVEDIAVGKTNARALFDSGDMPKSKVAVMNDHKGAINKNYGYSYVFQGDGDHVKELKDGIKLLKFANLIDDNTHAIKGTDVLLKNPIDKSIVENSILLNATQSACLKITTTMISGFGYYFKKNLEENKLASSIVEQPNNNIDESFLDIINSMVVDYKKWLDMYLAVKKLSDGSFVIKYVPASSVRIVPYNRAVSTSKKVKMFIEIQDNDWSYMAEDNYSSISYRKYKPIYWDTDIKEGVWYMFRWSKKNANNLFFAEPEYLSALYPISENKKIFEYNNIFFENNARPDFILVISGVSELNTDQKTKITTFLTSNYKGVNSETGKFNAHRTLFLQFDETDVKVEIKPISKDLPRDGSFRDLKNDNRDDIARAWNVPPKVIGISSAGSLGSGNEAIGALKLLKEYTKTDQEVIEMFVSNVIKKLTGFNPEFKLRKIELTNEKDKAIIFNLLADLTDEEGNPILPLNNVVDDLELEISDSTKKYVISKIKESLNSSAKVNDRGQPRGDKDTDEADKEHMGETDTDYL